MSDSLYLAWRYLGRHKGKTAILITSIALIVFLPVGLHLVVDKTTAELEERARTTPLLVGRRGSALELALSSLYFAPKKVDPLPMSQVDRIQDTGFALPIPLHVRFRAGKHPIVGTTLDYFDFRGLRVVRGNQMATLGECVLGADVAELLELGPGDTIRSSPTALFDFAGVYPLQMRIAGVLGRGGSPDDDAVFVDIKTAWIIEGIGHGHADLAAKEHAKLLLKRDGNEITASRAVVEYDEITPEQAASFHFHGDAATFPVTAILAVPHDAKSKALLMGKYVSADDPAQVIEPEVEMDELVATVVNIRSYVTLAVVLVSISTLLTAALVFLLSVRLRKREMATMVKIGSSRGTIASLLGWEVVAVLLGGIAVAACLTLVAHAYGPALLREMLL